MEFLASLIERLITSLVVSFCIFVVSFSFLTGKFPPKKADFVKSFSIIRQIVTSQKEFNQRASDIQSGVGSVNLEQLAEFQKLALKRTELGIEMIKIFDKIKLAGVDPNLETRLHRISDNMTAAETELNEVGVQLQQANEPQVTR